MPAAHTKQKKITEVPPRGTAPRQSLKWRVKYRIGVHTIAEQLLHIVCECSHKQSVTVSSPTLIQITEETGFTGGINSLTRFPFPFPPLVTPFLKPQSPFPFFNLPFFPEDIFNVLLLVKHRRIFANCSLCTTTPSPEKRTKIGESFLRRRLYTRFRNWGIYSSFIAIVIVKEIFSTKNHLKLFLVPSRLCPKWLKSCSQTCTCTVRFNFLC